MLRLLRARGGGGGRTSSTGREGVTGGRCGTEGDLSIMERDVCGLLTHLLEESSSAAAAVEGVWKETDGVAVILETMRRHELDSEVQIACTRALFHLASDADRAREIACARDGVAVLFSVLRRHDDVHLVTVTQVRSGFSYFS